MRIAFVVHGFPPHEHTGVETHVAALARNLARRGIAIEVFAPRADATLPEFAQRREQRDGYYLTWVIANRIPQSAAEHFEPAGMAAAFGEFLDRTRPALVHFHHVRKLGVAVLEEASRRGIPSLYTAHDYYPVCHRTILARPDLSRCSTLGDSRACARCDLAVSYLNGKNRWSDYHAGVLPGSLSVDEQQELARCLEPGAEDTQAAILDERSRLDRRRQEAFATLDLVLAPTEYLHQQLIAGGIDPARLELSVYGIESAALTALAPPRNGSERALTFGYIGGALKHKGLHVLLDAYARLELPARLAIHADSSDREYVDEMRQRARALGAVWHGAFAAGELPRVIDGIDVLVVPSIWWENAPFVIREAFAASRPVIASDLPALRESVSDGADGLLVNAGDAQALKLALERLVAEPELVARLSRQTRKPRSLEDLGDELVARYSAWIEKKRRAPSPQVPSSARHFAERVLALESQSVAELSERAASMLAELARSLGVEAGAAVVPEIAPIALERLHDARRELVWRVEGEAARVRELAQARGLLEANQALAEELARSVDDGELARRALARAQEELGGRAHEIELAARSQLAARAALELEQRAHVQARAALASASAALAELQSERAQLESLHRELDRALSETREVASQALQHGLELEEHLRQLKRHAQWLEVEAANFARRFGHAAQALRNEADVGAAHTVFIRLERELEWRRGEMRSLREEGGRIIRALVERSALGRRLRGWEREP